MTQIRDNRHVRIGAAGIGFNAIRLRLAYPPEFDLVAPIAGPPLRSDAAVGTGSRSRQ